MSAFLTVTPLFAILLGMVVYDHIRFNSRRRRKSGTVSRWLRQAREMRPSEPEAAPMSDVRHIRRGPPDRDFGFFRPKGLS